MTSATVDDRAERRNRRAVELYLHDCRGFRVETRGGRVGRVEFELYTNDIEHPSALAVRQGLMHGHRLLIVPAADVLNVIPERGCVVIRADSDVARITSR